MSGEKFDQYSHSLMEGSRTYRRPPDTPQPQVVVYQDSSLEHDSSLDTTDKPRSPGISLPYKKTSPIVVPNLPAKYQPTQIVAEVNSMRETSCVVALCIFGVLTLFLDIALYVQAQDIILPFGIATGLLIVVNTIIYMSYFPDRIECCQGATFSEKRKCCCNHKLVTFCRVVVYTLFNVLTVLTASCVCIFYTISIFQMSGHLKPTFVACLICGYFDLILSILLFIYIIARGCKHMDDDSVGSEESEFWSKS